MGEESGRKKLAGSFRERLWAIVFEAETPKGRAFDVALLWAIGLSVIAVMLESVDSIEAQWGAQLHVLEWCFTVVFSLEYVMRLWLVRRPLRYTFSFFGIVDLLSCLPSYLELFIPGLQTLLVIRILRLLRMFRVALVASRAKIMVFFLAVSIFAVLMGTLLYLVESGVEGTKFTNIPVSIYYTIITITTIGFGDIVTTTPVGMFLTAIAGLSGYAILAVPTGIVSAEMQAAKVDETTDACPSCGVHGHLYDAKFCRKCGERLNGG